MLGLEGEAKLSADRRAFSSHLEHGEIDSSTPTRKARSLQEHLGPGPMGPSRYLTSVTADLADEILATADEIFRWAGDVTNAQRHFSVQRGLPRTND